MLWVAVLAAIGIGAMTAPGTSSGTLSVPGTQSQKAIDLLHKEFPQASADGATARVVFEAPSGQKLTSAANKAEVESLVAKLEKSPQVSSVSDPFTSGLVSTSGTIAYAQVSYKVKQADVSGATHTVQTEVVAQGEKAGLKVSLGGNAVKNEATSKAAELIGVGVAAIVLMITFGSLIAAGLPLLTAILGVAAAILSITLATHFFDLASSATTLALMLGLAVAIDYALFIVSRYRNEIRDGHEPEEACGRALGTAGSAVAFTGLTVIVALSGLSVIGIAMLTSMGLGLRLRRRRRRRRRRDHRADPGARHARLRRYADHEGQTAHPPYEGTGARRGRVDGRALGEVRHPQPGQGARRLGGRPGPAGHPHRCP
ncbi:MMPL family transporter [Streptomyces sp. NPDC051001]|uniref:MMPL family transporter n=1 Tax=Streptomyces sp. NPDC051001 TaxID=3155795 RepID=UPI00343E6A47